MVSKHHLQKQAPLYLCSKFITHSNSEVLWSLTQGNAGILKQGKFGGVNEVRLTLAIWRRSCPSTIILTLDPTYN